MGIVYKAQDTTLDRLVALKFLPEDLARSSTDSARFLQEARAAAALNHPNICTIHGIEDADGRQFIVMEFVEGQTLGEKKGSLSQKQAIDIAIQVAEGLAAAHEKGITHRDIKPDNVMIRKDGIVQIMDFGLAKLRGVSNLTQQGSTVGTARYMSPEQVQGSDIDHRSDIFSLGVLLYEMFTGQLPFKGPHETALLYEIVNVDPEPMGVTRMDIPAELDAIVLECLAKEPAERYQSAAELARTLRRFKRESSRRRVTVSAAGRSAYRPALKDLGESPEASTGTHSLDRSGTASFWWRALAILFFVTTVAALAFYYFQGKSSSGEVIRMTVGPPEDATGLTHMQSLHGQPVVSPDGQRIAFSVARGDVDVLFIRSVDRFESVAIEGGGRRPFFSPDSRWVGFLRGETVWKAPATGGDASLVGELRETIWNIADQAWHPDGRILIVGSAGLWAFPTSGGSASVLVRPDTTHGEIFSQVSVAGSGEILLSVFHREGEAMKGGLRVISADGLTQHDLPSSIQPPACVVEDLLVFSQAGQWRAAYFDAHAGALLGDPVSITGLPPIPRGSQRRLAV